MLSRIRARGRSAGPVFAGPVFAGLVFAVACLASISGTAMAQGGADVVARLGTTDVTVADLRDFVRGLDPLTREQVAKDPQLLSRLVRVELARMAVLGEAKEKKWEEQPDAIRQIERARNQAIVASYLASVTALPPGFPSDADVQAAYDQNRDRFMVPRQYQLSQIFVAVTAGADKAAEETARKRVDDLAKRAKAKGANFADLARKNSDQADAAKTGGDLGWLPEPQILPEVRTVLAGMAKGEISDAIRSPGGWHIVQLVDTKAAGPRPLAEVRDGVVQYLRQRKAEELEQLYLSRLLENKRAAVNEIALGKLLDLAK